MSGRSSASGNGGVRSWRWRRTPDGASGGRGRTLPVWNLGRGVLTAVLVCDRATAIDRCDNEAEHGRVLGAPVHTGQPRTAVVLEQRQLALRAVGADTDLFDLLEQVCRERVGALPGRRDLRARAENVIVELLPYSTPSLDRVARRLGTSSRSLGRRLTEEGTSFKMLVDELRRELARRYLEQGLHRPKSIAALLGYKDLSAFHHAFRRWTGTTPAQFSQDPWAAE